jgi:hypothetical protein
VSISTVFFFFSVSFIGLYLPRFYLDVAEALVHTWLFLRGAGIAPTLCSCGKYHREFFDGWMAGGVAGVDAMIEFLLNAMGVVGWTK